MRASWWICCKSKVSKFIDHAGEAKSLKQGKEEKKVKIPAASYVIRMDQPYSRMADMLLDTQYYNISDPRPYDDTGWTLGALRNVKTIRVTDASILKAPMSLFAAPAACRRKGNRHDVHRRVPDQSQHRQHAGHIPFSLARRENERRRRLVQSRRPGISRGLVHHSSLGRLARDHLEQAAVELGLQVRAVDEIPKVAMHPLAAPRIALVHTWLEHAERRLVSHRVRQLKIPYDYISDQKLREMPDLRAKYDVIIFGPHPAAPSAS